jgi:hypothetical protein
MSDHSGSQKRSAGIKKVPVRKSCGVISETQYGSGGHQDCRTCSCPHTNRIQRSSQNPCIRASCLTYNPCLAIPYGEATTRHIHRKMKRTREDADYSEQPAKVRRVPAIDRLSKLSDELLVRILSFVPIPTLLVCQL